LDDKIKELEEKIKILDESGEKDLVSEKDALEKNIEAEAKKELAIEREEERKAREDPYGYGAQNEGFEEDKEGSGNDSDSDKPKKAKGKKDDEGGYFGKTKFEDDDEYESELTSAAYAKPSRGGGKAGRGGARVAGGKKYKFDEDDYPTL